MIEQKRGRNVAIAGAVTQAVVAAVMLILWLWTGSLAALSGMLFVLGGTLVWLMAALLFYARQLARREAMEFEEFAARGAASQTIFDRQEAGELRPAAARVAWMDKWVVPAFTLALTGYFATIGILLARSLPAKAVAIANAGPALLFTALVGFVAFLLSRYAVGMSRVEVWRLLRAPASFLQMGVLLILGLAASLLSAMNKYPAVDRLVAWVATGTMLVLSAELVLNFILDLYRPRLPGQEYRPSFDSRLFNLIADPGRVGHTVAEALNYQFGFEVSKTWFYQLLSRAMAPLVIFGAAVVVAMTSIVIVEDGEQVVVLHWGRPDPRGALGPGLHLKWPWPVDRADRFQVGQTQEIMLGAGEATNVDESQKRIMLWTVEHGVRKELDFLVAVPEQARAGLQFQGDRPPPPVNIIKLVAPVHYVIRDAYKYGYKSADARNLIQSLASREMVSYCASATLDSPAPGDARDRPEAIMTYGRAKAAEELRRRIQAAIDSFDLGVEVTFVGLMSAHPPADAAKEFEKVFEAERRVDEKRYKAQAVANQTLAKVAGDPDTALQLAQAIRQMTEMERLSQIRGAPAELTARLDQAIAYAKDQIASLQQEIAGEKLLGKSRQDVATTRDILLKSHQAHLAELERLKADPARFDFTSLLTTYGEQADRLFDRATGQPSVMVADAHSYRWQKEMAERGRYEAFQREWLAYKASPKVYSFNRWMDIWDEVLPDVNKYVLGVPRERLEVWLNWENTQGVMEDVTFQRPGQN